MTSRQESRQDSNVRVPQGFTLKEPSGSVRVPEGFTLKEETSDEVRVPEGFTLKKETPNNVRVPKGFTLKDQLPTQIPTEPTTAFPRSQVGTVPSPRGMRERQADVAIGAGEAALNIGSAMAAFPAQLAGRVIGGAEKGPGYAEKTAEAMTYQPRTKMGQDIAGVLGKPFELMGKGEDWLVEKAKENPEAFKMSMALQNRGYQDRTPEEIEHEVRTNIQGGILVSPQMKRGVAKPSLTERAIKGEAIRRAEKPVPKPKPPASEYKGLVVANRGADGKIYYGEPGQLHFHLSDKYSKQIRTKMNLKSGEPTWQDVGFARPGGEILSRTEALKATKVKPTTTPGELDAIDYRLQEGAKLEKATLKPPPKEKGLTLTKEEKQWYKKSHAKNPKKPYDIELKRPSILDTFRPQGYQVELMGAKKIIGPLEQASKKFDLAIERDRNFHRKLAADLNKAEKTPYSQRVKAAMKNEPTENMRAFSKIVNDYENAPNFLSPPERKIFNDYRNYTREMFNETNKALVSSGQEPFGYKEAYMRHVATDVFKDYIDGRYPFPEDFVYLMKKYNIQSKKVRNPAALERKLGDDLLGIWKQDFVKALDSMAYYHRKTQLFSQPKAHFNRMMDIYRGKDMPARTEKWLDDHANFLQKHETTLDRAVNDAITTTFLKKWADVMLKPFGRRVGAKPVTRVSQDLGRLTMAGVLGPRPKLITRNLHQKLQAMSFSPSEQWLKAFIDKRDPIIQGLMEKSQLLKSYTGLEEFKVGAGVIGKAEEIYHLPFRWSAINNARFAFRVGYESMKELITNPKYEKHGWASKERIQKGYPKEMPFTPEEMNWLLKEAEGVADYSQYQYTPGEMPKYFRHKTLAAGTRLTSWSMNYFLKYQWEAMRRAFTGKTTYGEHRTLPKKWRAAHLKYLVGGGAYLTKVGYERSYFLGVIPDNLAPVPEFGMGLYEYVSADTDRQRAKARYRMERSVSVLYPGALLVKDLDGAINRGESLIWYK